MNDYWNTHFIRASRHDTVSGAPNVLFFLPEQSGGFDCSVYVSQQKLSEMELECNYEIEENIYQEFFHYVMDNERLTYPTSHHDALELFFKLISIA
jgi:hypothetical protein